MRAGLFERFRHAGPVASIRHQALVCIHPDGKVKLLFTIKQLVTLRLRAGLWLFVCLLMQANTGFAQAGNIEQQVKAAFLLKFVTYVEWPPEAGTDAQGSDTDASPLTLGVAGAEDMATILEQMAGEQSFDGRPFRILRVEPGSPLDELDVLFVGQNPGLDASELLQRALDESVLTVTEDERAPADGGSVINFLIVDDRVAFDISLVAARHANLQLSSRLLQVAQRVFD